MGNTLDEKYKPKDTGVKKAAFSGSTALYKDLYDIVEKFEKEHNRPPYHCEVGEIFNLNYLTAWKIMKECNLIIALVPHIRNMWLAFTI